MERRLDTGKRGLSQNGYGVAGGYISLSFSLTVSLSLYLSLSLSLFLSLSLSPAISLSPSFTDGYTNGHTDMVNQAQVPRLLLTIPREP